MRIFVHHSNKNGAKTREFKKKDRTLEESGHKGKKKHELRRVLASLTFPLAFVLLLWLIKSITVLFDWEIYRYGIYPQSLSGLKGIIFSPFIHGSLAHLASNSIPLLVLGIALFYFYREVAPQVVIASILITGIWVWIIARESYHIGASGVIYSLAAFLFVSGILRRHPRLMALSLLVAFLYGGLVWGIFPVKDHISWESHLMGLIAGVILALFYRGYGPQRPVYSWELEEAVDDPETEAIKHPGEYEAETAGQATGQDAQKMNENRSMQNQQGCGGCQQEDTNDTRQEGSVKIKYDYKPLRSRSR